MKLRIAVPATAICGVLMAGFLIAASQNRGQAVQIPLTARSLKENCYPPHPSRIFNLTGSTGSIPGNDGIEVIYSVPLDQWLVLTWVELVRFGTGLPDLVQDLGGVLTNKLRWSQGPVPYKVDDGVGLAFAPGSFVVIRNSAGGGTNTVTARYVLTGYLVDA